MGQYSKFVGLDVHVRRAKVRQKLFNATTSCVENLPFPRE